MNMIKRKFPLLAFLVTSVMLFQSCGSSRRVVGIEEGWDLLGESKVNFVRDKDVVNIRSQNMYTAIRFTVEEKDVRLNGLKIHLNNGDILQPALDDVIKAGEQSRVIDLAADGRMLSKIEFSYRSMGSVLQGRANVIVTGRRYNPYNRY